MFGYNITSLVVEEPLPEPGSAQWEAAVVMLDDPSILSASTPILTPAAINFLNQSVIMYDGVISDPIRINMIDEEVDIFTIYNIILT